MKTSLSIKIFITFFLTYIISVALMIGIFHFVSSKKFIHYINEMDMNRLSRLSIALADIYKEHNNWTSLIDNTSAWRQILEDNIGEARPGRSSIPGPMGDTPPPNGFAPPHQWESPGERPQRAAGPPGPPPQAGGDTMPPDQIFNRLVLLNGSGGRIVGIQKSEKDQFLYKDILVNDAMVGRIGLRKIERSERPLEMNFLSRQLQMFCYVGIGALFFSAVVSFLLSRHFLAPIRQLIRGTQALSRLQFDKRIQVVSKDELGALAADFNQMAHTLERYEQMRRQWISDISHELRTPLSVIRGEIEAMQDGIRKCDETSLASLHAEVVTLAKTVGDLHELSLADSQALYFERLPVNPAMIFHDTLDHYRSGFQRRNISLEETGLLDQNCLISGDERRLKQLFTNICENSFRYSDSPGNVTAGAACVDGRITLFFEDSGPGVPPQALDRIFDRLFRVDFARAREGAGSGLGLSICKMIAEAHGGSIRAENSESGGLRIIVSFPLIQQ